MTSQGSRKDDYLRNAQGEIIKDRFGRPVLRRGTPTTQSSASNPTHGNAPVRRPRRDGSGASRPHQQPPAPTQQPATRYEAFPAQQRQLQQPQQQQPPRPKQYFPPAQPTRAAPSNYQQPQPRPVQPAHIPASPARRRRFRPRGCVAGFTWLVAIVLVLGIAGTLWLDSRLNRTDAEPVQHVANTAGTNWLLVGSDSRTGLSEEDVQRLGTGGDIGSMRTDTIMLLHIPRSGKATLVSLPRDSYVNIPGYGMNKINAAFTFGGAPLLSQTVEEATGLRIDHYAEIGMGGLANVVDAVGGIEVCPEYPIEDPLANLYIGAGCQTIDGPTALGYVRTRATPMGDLDRVQRQREFFTALVKKTSSTGTLANPLRIMPTINTVTGSFTVGESDHVWNLARVGLAMRGGLATETVPVAGFGDYDVGSVVLWDEAAAAQLFSSLQ
ncbi:transcriptional attenuator, LytR family [Corynebacterium mustelae]|uniref:Transcriptional attenuator, LytR family n=1 Tax=Corynebacterium mustelae TaxID=571915 RepID=A0A0G3H5T3_9CORY|nr:LCP family protein [Corynebacterium mustelae]AKK07183.1 transcriptional attenuator, LytR family [Corynebacterium mustelae]